MLPTTLEIEVKEGKHYNIIYIFGKLDTTVFKYFTETCTPYAEKNNIIFNLTRLNYISSSGIGGLFKLMKIAEQNKFKVVLCCMQPSIKEVIKLTKLDNIFLMAETEEDAAKTLK